MLPINNNFTPTDATPLAPHQIADCGASSAPRVASEAKPNRADLYFAAIDCDHSISEERIILSRNPALPGNALSQLADRLIAAALGAQS